MNDDMLRNAIEHMLTDQATPQVVRAIEHGGSSAALWKAIDDSGFCDALVPEAIGGAGLGLRDGFVLFEACGRHAVPVPFAQTVMARALLAEAGRPVPAGAIALASGNFEEIDVPYGAVADWVLVDAGSTMLLLDARDARREVLGGVAVDARMQWASTAKAHQQFESRHDLRAIAALVFAAQLAGSMGNVLAQTLQYANERQQFGRSIGKFQVIQHHLAVMAEHTEAARMAARMACACDTPWPDALLSALAKACTSEVVVPVAATAHAVHGAIGITEEYDLQLHTRRLHAWRVAAGSETYWHQRIGRALLAQPFTMPDFVRRQLSPPPGTPHIRDTA